MAKREIKFYIETCDFCKEAFQRSSEEPALTKPVYFFYFGGYGDMERITESKDACGWCYQQALDYGYGERQQTAKYVSRIGKKEHSRVG